VCVCVCTPLGILTRCSSGAEIWHRYVIRPEEQDFFGQKSCTRSVDRKLAGNKTKTGIFGAGARILVQKRHQSTRLIETHPVMCILHSFKSLMTGSEPENVEKDAPLEAKRNATHAAGSQHALGY
jgi:hypothetical protein